MRGTRARIRGALLIAATALVLLPLGSAHQRGLLGERAESAERVVLDVALVNEDAGAVIDGDDVNLGRSYVTQLESDPSARWWVVSRSVAEHGLAGGAYDLMLVVPTGFSGALADLDTPDPAPVGITYQVNGAGNSRVEALATGKGEELVARLDAQLVDMYVASVLGNLHQAQSNARLLVDARATTGDAFTTTLRPAQSELSTGLATLVDRASAAVVDDEVGVDALGGLALATADQATASAVHGASLAGLLAARDRGALTQAELVEALMALDHEVLGEQVQQLDDALVDIGATLAAQLEPDAGGASLGDRLVTLGAVLDGTRAAARGREDALSAQGDEQVLAAYRAAVYAVLDTDGDGTVSVAEVTAPSGDTPAAGGDLLRAAEAEIALLPYRTEAELDAAVRAGVFASADDALGGAVAQIAVDLGVLQGWTGYADVEVDPDGTTRADLEQAAATLAAASGDLAVPAATRYGGQVAQVAQAYRHARLLVELVHVDASAAIDAVILAAVAEQVASERAALGAVGVGLDSLDAATSEVRASSDALLATSRHLSTMIAAHLDQLRARREALTDLHTVQDRVVASEAERSTHLDRITVEGAGLLASSDALAAAGRSAVDRADAGLALTGDVRSDVQELLAQSVALDGDAGSMAAILAGETESAQVFADSFSAVLPHAYVAGVLNETLVDFLASPVTATPREPVPTADVTRPFGWVVIIFALCLVAGHLLGSSTRWETRGSVLTSDRAARLGIGSRALGRAAGAGLLVGAGASWATAVGLDLPPGSLPHWVLCVVLGCVELTLLTSTVVRRWRAVGAALCVVLLVGYVLVSDAVGAGARSGFESAVARVDPLCHLETAMAAVLGAGQAGATWWPLAAGTVVVVTLGLVVRTDLPQPERRRSARAAVPA